VSTADRGRVRTTACVEIEPAAEQDVPIYGEWVGTTVGYVTAQIRARVSGYLMRQNYKEGTLARPRCPLRNRSPDI